jgi:DNA mismatch repair protein MutS
MTSLANAQARVKNVTMAVREWENDVVFLHEVVPGAADRSYGIQVARLAGLPETVLSRARQVLGVLESRSSGNSAPMLDDLPLFAAAPAPKKPDINPLDSMLDQVRPDELTPRQALDMLYELKKIRDAGRRS